MGLLVRLQQLDEVDEAARPGFIAAFSALGNAVTNMCLCAMFRHAGLLQTSPSLVSLSWGFLGALDVNFCQVLACGAFQLLGIAAAPAIWCGVGMAVSFLWGVFVFGEPVKSAIGASCALLVLAAGVATVASAQTELPTKIRGVLCGRSHNSDEKLEAGEADMERQGEVQLKQ